MTSTETLLQEYLHALFLFNVTNDPTDLKLAAELHSLYAAEMLSALEETAQ